MLQEYRQLAHVVVQQQRPAVKARPPPKLLMRRPQPVLMCKTSQKPLPSVRLLRELEQPLPAFGVLQQQQQLLSWKSSPESYG